MSSPPCRPLYVPILHPEALPSWLPDGLYVFSPGLEQVQHANGAIDAARAHEPMSEPASFNDGNAPVHVEAHDEVHATGKGCTPALFRSPCLPYSPQEAKACLADLKRMDADTINAAVHPLAAKALRQSMSPHEVAALADFVKQGLEPVCEKCAGAKNVCAENACAENVCESNVCESNVCESNVCESNGCESKDGESQSRPHQAALTKAPRLQLTPSMISEARCRAQRLLLLAWLQEEHVHDITALAARYHEGMALLSRQLGDGDDESPTPDKDPLASDAHSLLAPWPFVTELMAVLLPHWTEGGLSRGNHDSLQADHDLIQGEHDLIQGEHALSAPPLSAPPLCCLCSSDPHIRSDIEERGLNLVPLPSQVALADLLRREQGLNDQEGPHAPSLLPEIWFTPNAPWRFFGNYLPLWRLLGRPGPEPGRPWLHASILFLFVERSYFNPQTLPSTE